MAVGIIADAEDFRLCGIVDVKRKIVTGHNPVEQGEDTPDDNLRLFPMPTYDISDETHTKVTVHGELIDENYTDILNNNPDL
ncbi:MAG: hypothetical protein LBS69_00535, partial [Prevotellaceae bacterium]|nr:hypothetical protein [Prevotellaceae bacterium]